MSVRFHQSLVRPSIKGFLLKQLIQEGSVVTKPTVARTALRLSSPNTYQNLPLSLAALNINDVRTPPILDPAKARIPPPQPLPQNIELPQIKGNVTYEDQIPTVSMEEPSSVNVPEKQAARLIVIRKKKMKKHKLRKLRKKMKFEWAKVRQKRELKKEKMFQARLLEQIRLAQSFDPAQFAAEKLAKAKEVELPQVWYGVRYPDFIIKQLLEEREKKQMEKEADEKRKARMSPFVKDYMEKISK
uniref:Ribosomal protein mS38 C-terminal domain-containing protein n=1 Tax=Graphocephala atropunctata TaxID=36148 RepID=A0A1B6L6M7_9HEMI